MKQRAVTDVHGTDMRGWPVDVQNDFLVGVVRAWRGLPNPAPETGYYSAQHLGWMDISRPFGGFTPYGLACHYAGILQRSVKEVQEVIDRERQNLLAEEVAS